MMSLRSIDVAVKLTVACGIGLPSGSKTTPEIRAVGTSSIVRSMPLRSSPLASVTVVASAARVVPG